MLRNIPEDRRPQCGAMKAWNIEQKETDNIAGELEVGCKKIMWTYWKDEKNLKTYQ